MDSNHTGETTVSLGGRDLVLVYDWRAVSALKVALRGADVFEALAGNDPETLAAIVAIGLQRHHPGMTAAEILDASPPLIRTTHAAVRALNRAFWGAEVPPPADPQTPAAAAPTAGILSSPG
jgi:hypothetical protein